MPEQAAATASNATGGAGMEDMDAAEQMLLTMKNLNPPPAAQAAQAAAGAGGGSKRGAGSLHIPPMTPTAAAMTGRRTPAASGGGRGRKKAAATPTPPTGTVALPPNGLPGLPMPPPVPGVLPPLPMGPPIPGMSLGLAVGGTGGGPPSVGSSGSVTGGGGGGGHKRKRSATPSDLCQRCLVEGVQRGITHWHKDASRSTGGICKEHAFELSKKDPQGFALAYRMRHGRACERCGILRRATHGYLGEGVSRFCGECAGAQRGCVDLNNFKCKIQSCNRMARFIGAERDRLVFRCWAHKAGEMKEAGTGWRDFYADFCARAAANGGAPPLLDHDPATGQLLAVPMHLPPPPPPMPLPGQTHLGAHHAPPLPLPVPVPLTALSGDAEGLAIDRAGGSFAAATPLSPTLMGVNGDGGQGQGSSNKRARTMGGVGQGQQEQEEEEEGEEEEEEEEDVVVSDVEEDGGEGGAGESKEGMGGGEGLEGEAGLVHDAVGALPHPPTESFNI